MQTLKAMQEYVEFDHPTLRGWRWRIDLTTMLSGFGCIWGKGCPGIENNGDESEGCCSLGVGLSEPTSLANEDYLDYEGDLAKISPLISSLTPEQWQQHKEGNKKWYVTCGNELKTRKYKNRCIFSNDASFGRPGCALHHAALDAGDSPMKWKPDTCWYVPLFIEELPNEQTFLVRKSYNRDWAYGADNDKVLDWWCDIDPVANSHQEPMYVRYKDELIGIMGEVVYASLCEYIKHAIKLSVSPENRTDRVSVTFRTKPQPPAETSTVPFAAWADVELIKVGSAVSAPSKD